VTVEVLTSPVVPHRGARISVPRGDLDIPEVHASIEPGRDKPLALWASAASFPIIQIWKIDMQAGLMPGDVLAT
jgi:hypothetical protein